MGKKKTNGQKHVQNSMGQMVSRAALAQLGPDIERLCKALVLNLGQQLARQQLNTLENLFSRSVMLERIIMEKLGYTAEDLAKLVADVEDEKEKLTPSESIELNDVVRLFIQTKTKDQAEYQGESKLKVYKTGTGNTLGAELETAIIGMKTGETKEIEFGDNKELLAKITINRISRPEKAQEATTQAATEETQNASEAQGQ